jgi:4-amino-4-deoxy-L-arabinose transferase-like glycosyltransferase
MLTGLNETLSSPVRQTTNYSSLRWLNTAALLAFLIYALVLVVLLGRGPLELYDESRNANNAIEMAHNGHWLATYYDGAPDHWNTKPPLLIWIIAGLMKLGIPAIAALRLPSVLAALGTVVLIYLFCRILIDNTAAGAWSALLLMSSAVFFGPHMAMNGDYDALLCFFTTAYCLAFWVYVENIEGRARWGLVLTAAALILAVMTKGVAGALPLPGLLLYVVLRKKLAAVLTDWRFWLALLAIVFAIAVYYKGRDLVDPGYTKAVWQNELTGRYMAVNEGHRRKALFFARVLVDKFKPGVLLLPLGCLFLIRPAIRAGRAYSAAILCAATSLVLLLVLSKSQTKIWYYCGPAIPLLAILCAIGAAEFPETLRRFTSRAHSFPLRTWAAAITAFLVVTSAWTLYQNEHQQPSLIPQDQYGFVLGAMEPLGIKGPVLLVDDGVATTANFPHYNPIGSFYGKLAAERGMQVVLGSPENQIAPDTWVTTCDPKSATWLRSEHALKSPKTIGACIFGETSR